MSAVARRRSIALRAGVALIVAVGLLFVVVFPVRAWMDQQSSIHDSETRLEILRRERVRLDSEAQRLNDPAEIERLARLQFNMIRPGEQAWVAVPALPTTTTTSTTLPVAL